MPARPPRRGAGATRPTGGSRGIRGSRAGSRFAKPGKSVRKRQGKDWDATIIPSICETGQPLSADEVGRRLAGHFDTLDQVAAEAGLSAHARDKLAKARRVLDAMQATIAFFWTMIATRLAAWGISAAGPATCRAARCLKSSRLRKASSLLRRQHPAPELLQWPPAPPHYRRLSPSAKPATCALRNGRHSRRTSATSKASTATSWQAHDQGRKLPAMSNRTYRRILLSLQPEVARRHGYVKGESQLEEQVLAAVATGDWRRVTVRQAWRWHTAARSPRPVAVGTVRRG